MIKEAIDRILELQRPPTVEVNGTQYWAATAKVVQPPQPVPLHVSSLAAVVKYIAEEVDGSWRLFLHVYDNSQVAILSPVDSETLSRTVWLLAQPASVWVSYNIWTPIEDFIIDLQSNFAAVGDRARVLQLLGNVDEQEARTDADDGVTQHVSTRRGVHLVGGVSIENPVMLAPFRTFPEVEQPVSPFILRVRGGERKEAALFPADGEAWRLEAIKNIAEFLREKLPEGVTILA